MIYCYYCQGCGTTMEVSRSMKEDEPVYVCENCNTPMSRDYQAEHTAVRGNYKRPIVMESLGVHPSEIAEYRKQFPQHELASTSDGFMAPVAHSLGEKRQILKDHRWVDKNSYV